MLINEIYCSISGEGKTAGIISTIVRLQGCNLRCSWCDSKYTWDNHSGEIYTLDETIEEILKNPPRHVLITGGEPLMQPIEVGKLQRKLSNMEYTSETYTNGTLPIWELPPGAIWSMDWKMPSSGYTNMNLYHNIEILGSEDQLKFVVANAEDVSYAIGILSYYRPTFTVLFQPVWKDFDTSEPDVTYLIDLIKEKYPRGRISLQLHKYIYGSQTRRV